MSAELIQSVGVPVAIVALLILGIWKAAPTIWTWGTSQIEQSREQQQKMISDFSETMKGFKQTIDNQHVSDARSKAEFTALVERMDAANSTRAQRVLTTIAANSEQMARTEQALDRNSEAFKQIASALKSSTIEANDND